MKKQRFSNNHEFSSRMMNFKFVVILLNTLLPCNEAFGVNSRNYHVSNSNNPHLEKGYVNRQHQKARQQRLSPAFAFSNNSQPLSSTTKGDFQAEHGPLTKQDSSRLFRHSRRTKSFLSKVLLRQRDEALDKQHSSIVSHESDINRFDKGSFKVTNRAQQGDYDSNFILQNFESLSPSMLFSEEDIANSGLLQPVPSPLPEMNLDEQILSMMDSQLLLNHPHYNEIILKAKQTTGYTNKSNQRTQKQKLRLLKKLKRRQEKQSLFQVATGSDIGLRHAIVARITRAWVQKFLRGLLNRWTIETPQNLNIQCLPQGNILARLIRGYLRCDARIQFEKVVFPGIRLSSGSLETNRMSLNILAFRQRQSPQQQQQNLSNVAQSEETISEDSVTTVPKYKNQFDFHANDCTFTKDDLFQSNCIRNGLQTLLVRILKRRGIEPSTCTVRITSIDILTTGKIAIYGEAYTVFGATLPFGVRTKIDISSRGHVVTFPGLEISFGPSFGLGLYIPIVPTVDLDIGHNAKIRDIYIDGKNKLITLSASATITPNHTIKLPTNYRQSSNSYSALFSVDVGQWLTNIGNFAT